MVKWDDLIQSATNRAGIMNRLSLSCQKVLGVPNCEDNGKIQKKECHITGRRFRTLHRGVLGVSIVSF
jgi:hypothetical protein